MVDYSIPLQVQPPQINPLQAMLVASQLRAAENQNALTQFGLQERQTQANALTDYRQRLAANDPSADQALAGVPDLMTKVIQARSTMQEAERKTLDDNLLRNAQGAQRVLALPADQRAAAWREELDTALKDRRINPLQYERMKGMTPDEKTLAPIVKAGLSISDQITLEQREKDREAGREFSRGMTTILSGGGGTAPAAAGPAPSYFTTLRVAESGNDPSARPIDPETGKPASSAQGLFQFTKGTWADVATKNPGLDLKPEDRTGTDPASIAKQEAAAKAFTAENAATLVRGDHAPTDRNLYMAHFLGGDGAVKFLNGLKENPNAPATSFVSKDAADKNKSVFFDSAGMPKTALGVYNSLTNKFAGSNTVATGAGMGERTIAGIPTQKLIPFLAAGAMTPGLPKESRDVALELFKTVLAENKPSETQKHYLDYVRQEMQAGRTPKTMIEYQKELAEAGRSQVNIDQRQEGEFQKELGKGLAKQFNEMAEDGIKAADDRALYGRLGQLLEASGTGTGVALVDWVRANTGAKLSKNADAAEASSSLINYLKPRMRVPGTGASSDKDLDAFGRAIPSMLSTEGGRRTIIETLGGMAEARQRRGDIAMRVQMGELTPKQATEEIRKLGDPFKSFRDWQGTKEGGAGRQTEEIKPPEAGEVKDGYRFKGGNPALPESWEKVGQ